MKVPRVLRNLQVLPLLSLKMNQSHTRTCWNKQRNGKPESKRFETT
jgi:hypothetical protein